MTDRAHRERPTVAGIVPVVEVPFTADEQVDVDGFRTVVSRQVAAGADGVMFPGLASEHHKLASDERERLVAALLDELAVERARGRAVPVPVISVSAQATVVAVREAVRACAAGAGGINLLLPSVHPPSADAVRDHVAAVAGAVAPIPLVVQRPPGVADRLDVGALSALAEQHPNLEAVKVEGHAPGPFISALADARTPVRCLVGYAGLHAIEALERGAVGIQPGCSFTELYVDLHRRWLEGDRDAAVRLHTRMLPYLTAWMQHVELIVAVEKLISVERGWFASATVRSPGWRLDDLERSRVDRFLTEFGHRLT